MLAGNAATLRKSAPCISLVIKVGRCEMNWRIDCRLFGFALTGVTLLAISTAPAKAISKEACDARIALARMDTQQGIHNADEEKIIIANALREYAAEQSAISIPDIGQALVDGQPTVFAAPGTDLTLTFDFIDPSTGLATNVGPSLSRVDYYANLDPSTPGVFGLIGSSTDALTNFALPFVDVVQEPQILAVPFDLSSNAVSIIGVAGDNDAPGTAVALVPEPATFIPGLMTLGALGWRRRRATRRAAS